MQKAGKYEILRKIGAGGFGVVFEGRDPFIKRRVAIKTCTSEEGDIRERFFREAEIAGNLQHKNIVTIHDFGFEEGVPYLVQEFLPGEDLSQMIVRKDPISLGRKLDLLLQTAHGMAYAHSQGVIHRDIKPNNIRVLEDWRVKIMDFGIAKLANVESQLTKEGMTVGTAAYLPPEQIRGEKVDTRADIFSYGVLAYELLTYSRPFDGKTLSTLLYQILSQEPKSLLEVWPEAPPRVAKLVASCLEKDVAKRCRSFETVESELAAAIADASVIDATNLIPQQPSERPAASSTPPATAARSELLEVSDKVRRAVDAGDLTAAELELTLAEKSWGKNAAFEEIVGPLRDELAGARGRQDGARRRAEKLRLLLERGVERLDGGEFVAARHAFEAALELDPTNAEGAEGISRADAGLAWEAQEAVRAHQVAELVRAGEEAIARDEPEVAVARAREALALESGSAEAARLLEDAEGRVRARAAEAARREESDRRAHAAAEAERPRFQVEQICRAADALLGAGEPDRAAAEARRAVALDSNSPVAHSALERAEGELRRLAREAEQQRRREAEAVELQRRREAEAAEQERRRQEEAAALARRRLELGDEIEALFAKRALGKVEKLLAKGERELGNELCAPWRARLVSEREAAAAAEAEERAAEELARHAAEAERRAAQEAKRSADAAKRAAQDEERARAKETKGFAAEEVARAKEEERRRAASAKADMARAKSVEATAGTQLPSASFASAKLTDPQTLKWIGGAAAGLAAVALVLWFALGRRAETPASGTKLVPAAEPVAAPAPAVTTSAARPQAAPAAPPAAEPSATLQPAEEPAKSPLEPSPAEQTPESVPPAASAPPILPPQVEAPAAPAPLDLALARARAQLAAGDRRGALATLGEALRIAPGDATTLTILGSLRREEERQVAAARQRALSAGADRFAAASFGEAERAANRMASSGSQAAAVEAAWRAEELFGEAAKEASARQEQQQAAAAIPAPSLPLPARPAPTATVPVAPGAASALPTAPQPSTAPPASGALVKVLEGSAPGAASPAQDPVGAIRASLERFRAANEALDARALAAVWKIDEAASRSIAKAFSGYNSLSMLFDKCSVQIDGDAATARCLVTQRIDVKVGSDLRSTQEITFGLRREGERWLILSRTAR